MQELIWDTIAILIYFQHLVDQGPHYRPPQSASQPSQPPTKAGRRQGRDWDQKTPQMKRKWFMALQAQVSECKKYLEERVFEIKPSDLHQQIREYLEKHQQNTEAVELLKLTVTPRNPSKFELDAMAAAQKALIRRRRAFGLNIDHVKAQVRFSRTPPLHPSGACANLKSLHHVFLLLQEERRTNADLFRAAVSSFNELVSIPPFSGVRGPLRKIENPSDALKDLQLINSPLTELIPEALPSDLHAGNRVRPPIHLSPL
ncbi:hypothetical protein CAUPRSCDRAFT_12467 [Caulochytrium protostelioides]|uniref:Uncharacterized protein n=1 Tax=Caulochytrium protostelioides TaxID=1555241 RepID=A0A4P9WRT5_9FUNG|nr:hypothetical protein CAUPRSCDRAFT_12467 [Caulochytrium protostelioides]